MSNYNPLTNFTAKDSLTTGDPQKIIRGADFDAEFDSISTAVNSKADANNAALTGSSSAVDLDVTGTFELGGTAVTSTATELNILDGVTANTAELNILDGVTANTAELNQLDGNVFTANLTIPDKIIHAGDTNTAIRFPAADTWTVETAGTERVRVTSTGNVGIGTNDPSSPLQISSTSSARLLLTNPTFVNDDQSSANISYEAGDSSFAIQGRTSGGVFKANWMKMFTNTSGQVTDHVWYTGSSAERMRIDSSGNVGIGTTSPDSKLHVNSSAGSRIRAETTSTTDGHRAELTVKTGSQLIAGGSLIATNANETTYPANAFGLNVVEAIPLWFGTGNTERMRITGTGNVGINNNNPSSVLDVDGDVTISDKIRHAGDTDTAIRFPAADTFTVETGGSERVRVDSSGNVGIGTTSPTSALTVSGRIETVNGADIDMDGSASGHLMLDGAGYGAAIALNAQGANFYTNSSQRGIIFGVNETEVMRIDSSGNVGIGTSSPSSPLGFSKVVEVKGTSVTFALQETSGGSRAELGLSTAGITLGSNTATPIRFFSGASEVARIDSTGNVGIGTTSPATLLHVDGTIRYTNRPAAGTITALGFDANGDLKASSSSLRYKHDIQDYGKGLAEVMQLRPVSFKFNGEDITNIGFIAEEVDALGMTEVMLYDDEDRPEGIQYANMVSLLTKAIQEQQDIINDLRARVAKLEAKA